MMLAAVLRMHQLVERATGGEDTGCQETRHERRRHGGFGQAAQREESLARMHVCRLVKHMSPINARL